MSLNPSTLKVYATITLFGRLCKSLQENTMFCGVSRYLPDSKTVITGLLYARLRRSDKPEIVDCEDYRFLSYSDAPERSARPDRNLAGFEPWRHPRAADPSRLPPDSLHPPRRLIGTVDRGFALWRKKGAGRWRWDRPPGPLASFPVFFPRPRPFALAGTVVNPVSVSIRTVGAGCCGRKGAIVSFVPPPVSINQFTPRRIKASSRWTYRPCVRARVAAFSAKHSLAREGPPFVWTTMLSDVRDHSGGTTLAVSRPVAENRPNPPGGWVPSRWIPVLKRTMFLSVKMGKGPLGDNRLPSFRGSMCCRPMKFLGRPPRMSPPPGVYWDSSGIRTGSSIGNPEAVSQTREPSRRLT